MRLTPRAMARSSRRKEKAEAVRTIKAWQAPSTNKLAAANFLATAGDWQLNTSPDNSRGSGDFGGFVWYDLGGFAAPPRRRVIAPNRLRHSAFPKV